MTDPYAPSPDDRFSFGLWTVGNPGRDPFGLPTRPPLEPVELLERLAPLGAWGVSLHDDDLLPSGAPAAEQDAAVERFRRALSDTGLRVGMVTANLFSHPVFKDGAFTANDPAVRRHAIRKSLDAIDLAALLGAEVYVIWGGREGVECDAAKDVPAALDCYAEGVNVCCAYIRERGYEIDVALEPKPNEPRGRLLLPTVGHALAFIAELEFPDMVGLNPEFAHETMAGLSVHHAVAQTLWADKLFHIDLNGQVPGVFDQDYRFGAEGLRDAFYLVKLLEEAEWDGIRHFDAHPYRTEDPDGVWDFARGCMRTYLMLREKARRFATDPEIQEARRAALVERLDEPALPDGPTVEAIGRLRAEALDLDATAARGCGHERLDQLVTELLMGVR